MHIELKCNSTQEWRDIVIANFGTFMADHADCERKAASTALALISRFPEHPEIVEPMISLAREELAHFRTMYRILQKNDIHYVANCKDPYIEKLTKNIRHPEEEYFLDRLLIAAIIEERACERLAAIAPHIQDENLARIYQSLAEEEKAHGSIFVKLAMKFYNKEIVQKRLDDLLDKEAEILKSIPVRAAIH